MPDVTASILQELRWRELIAQESDPTGAAELLATPQSVYAGFDPTSDSLHIGNLLPLLALRRFQLAGHRPIVVLGGATGLIGDPSGKRAERTLNEKEVVDAWTESLRGQVTKLLDFGPGEAGGLLVNNYDWFSSLSLITYLRDVGKHFSVNAMIAKDSVRSRLDRQGVGISYTEFSYMVLQAYDFLHLYEQHGCRLQAGGNDQWGNITAGIELIGHRCGVQSYGLTFPLITTASGQKFGKTEAGAVWLDPVRTSPYAFYQYWVNVDDRDAASYLRYFTFLPQEEIDALAAATAARPEAREAQRRLAAEVTELLHGATAVKCVLAASEALFGAGDVRELDLATLEMALASVPHLALKAEEEVPPLSQLLADSGLAPSKSQARRAVESGGVYLNGLRVSDPEYRPQRPADFLHGRLLVLRRGRKNYALVQSG